jgi:hypothetical protein
MVLVIAAGYLVHVGGGDQRVWARHTLVGSSAVVNPSGRNSVLPTTNE